MHGKNVNVRFVGREKAELIPVYIEKEWFPKHTTIVMVVDALEFFEGYIIYVLKR